MARDSFNAIFRSGQKSGETFRVRSIESLAFRSCTVSGRRWQSGFIVTDLVYGQYLYLLEKPHCLFSLYKSVSVLKN
jgi:hypothetical protein